jgi:hypothetical protein
MSKNKIQNSKFKIQKLEKGVSIYLVILISTFILTVVLGLSTILISRIKVSREIGYSVIAFYGADTGIEKVLMDRENPTSTSGSLNLNGDFVTYSVTVNPSSTCGAANYCISSSGIFKGVRRAIEIGY